jgi:hypothetical protein
LNSCRTLPISIGAMAVSTSVEIDVLTLRRRWSGTGFWRQG